MNTTRTTLSNTDSSAADSDDPGSPGSCDEPDQPDKPKGQVDLTVQCAPAVRRPIDVNWIRDHLLRAVDLLGAPAVRICINIIDDAEMSQLHVKHSNDPSTTDVLTFCNDNAKDAIDADIAICADEAARQIAHPGDGGAIERELLLYALHGLLHCAGFNDHEEIAYRAMHLEEDRILEAIGVGGQFAQQDEREDESTP